MYDNVHITCSVYYLCTLPRSIDVALLLENSNDTNDYHGSKKKEGSSKEKGCSEKEEDFAPPLVPRVLL